MLSYCYGRPVTTDRRKARKPVVLRVLAKLAHDDGVQFYEGNEKVWLADEVPPRFIVFNE